MSDLTKQMNIVSELQESHSVTVLCEAFDINTSTFNYHRAASKRINPETVRINAMVSLSNGSVGARTIAHMVSQQGTPLSRYRATGFMRRLELVSSQPPAHSYKKALQPHSTIPNTLSREFNVEAPNQVWCGDVTYIWTGRCWSYLAVVLDLFARKPVGWALSDSPDSELTSKALTMAYELRGKPKGVLFHSESRMSLHKREVQTACLEVPHETEYYSQYRPHQHNGGLPPNTAEILFFNSSKFSDQNYLTTTLSY